MRPRIWSASLAFPNNLNDIRQLLEAGHAAASERAPASTPLDIFEHDDRFEVWLDVPGVNREDLKLSIEDDTLTIQGERPAQALTEEASRHYRRTERWTGPFSRSLRLPGTVEGTRIEAKLADGVLKVVLPKRDQAKPRQIPING